MSASNFVCVFKIAAYFCGTVFVAPLVVVPSSARDGNVSNEYYLHGSFAVCYAHTFT